MKAVVYSGTRNVYGDMVTAAKSLLCHTKIDRVYFLIEDDEFQEPLPDIVETINVSGQEWFSYNSPNFNNHWTYMVLLRVAYAKLFPKLDRIVSLDIDTIVEADVSELWSMDFNGNLFIACAEPNKNGFMHPYCNFGVHVQNLDGIRQEHADDAMIELLNKRKFFASEQDAANLICYGRFRIIPSIYNGCAYTVPCKNPRIIHYAGFGTFPWSKGDWHDEPPVLKYKAMSWDEVMTKQKTLI